MDGAYDSRWTFNQDVGALPEAQEREEDQLQRFVAGLVFELQEIVQQSCGIVQNMILNDFGF